MQDKPDLVLYDSTPISNLPGESLTEFKQWVLNDGLKPSVALRRLMEKYDCTKLDSSVPINMVKYAYPDIDIAMLGLRSRIVDSDYPNSKPDQFSDEDFDKGIEELLSYPPDR